MNNMPTYSAFGFRMAQIWAKKAFYFFILILSFLVIPVLWQKAYAGVETIPTGSKIVNMGVTPQTVANGLKPYGLVYELLKNNVPVKWVINSSKVKDGIDFSHNGIDYRGSAFIILKEYLTPGVNTIIGTWTAKGVVVNTTVSSFTANVFQTLKTAPFWTLDTKHGKFAVSFFQAAEIPSTAYIFKEPSKLSSCDDIYVLPHSDPTWETHKNLWYWNLTNKGAIWAGCRAVSALENTYGPDVYVPAITRRMNFLMNDGSAGPDKNALDFAKHHEGTPPYTLQHSTHPVMQFMGKTDGAHQGGPEQIYMPYKPGGSWRSTSLIGSFDPSQSDVPTNSDGPAAAIVFGRGFGDPNRGWVVYEGGHKISGTSPDEVAAQRVFFNSSFYFVVDKAITSSMSGGATVMIANQTYNGFTVSASSPIAGTTLSYQWTSSCGGTFSNPNGNVTNFTAPNLATVTDCIITCIISDPCGRTSSESRGVTIIPGPRNPLCSPDTAIVPSCINNYASINVLANDSDPDGGGLTVTLLGGGAKGTFTNLGNGNISYTPTTTYTGSDQVSYKVCNANNLCCTTTVTMITNLLDGNGCNNTQYWGVGSNINASSVVSSTNVTNPTYALGDPDGVAGDNTTYASFANSSNATYMLSAAIPVAGNLYIYNDASNTRSFTVEQSTDNISFTNAQVFSSTTADDFLESSAKVYPVNTNTRYIRITVSNGSVWIDGMSYDVYTCLDAAPQMNNDEVTTLEDVPVIIDVLDNDESPKGHKMVVTGIAMQPGVGKVSINPDNTITYLNLKDQKGTGIDSFTYRVCDTLGLCRTAKVYVNIVADGCAANQYKPSSTTKTTVTLSAVADSYIRQNSATVNYGNNVQIKIRGKNDGGLLRSVVRFNYATIPSNAIIDSARLSLYMYYGGAGENIAVHRLSRAFTEGTGAANSGITWNRYDGTNSWTTAGGDFDTTVFANTNVGTTVGVYKNWNVRSLVQGFVKGTYPTYGMLLMRRPEATSGGFKEMKFGAREAGNSNEQPKLYIAYRTPAACTAIPAYPPLAMPDTSTTNAVTAKSISVLSNDYDYNASGMTVSLSRTTSRKGGSLSVSGTNVIYTPPTSPYFNGIDTFTYLVTSSSLVDSANVYVMVTNAPPLANRDDYSLSSNTLTTPSSSVNDVTINDTDPEGSLLNNIVITVLPKNGVATVSGKIITYTPDYNFIGKDTLIYRLTEGYSSDCILQSDTALVVYTVNNRAPLGITDNVTIDGCEIKTIKVLNNDTDPEGGVMTVQIVTTPSIGTVTLTNNNTEIQYTPPAGVTGTSTSFTYKVCDSEVPSVCSGNITVNITIRASPAANTAPVAVRDSFNTNLNSVLRADVLTNDYDPDGHEIRKPVTIITQPLHGTAVALGIGLVEYTPANDYFGVDSFYYRITDSIPSVSGCTAFGNLSGYAWAKIVIQDAPLANWDGAATNKNTPVTINVIANDIFGADGPAWGTISVITPPMNGFVSILPGSNPNQSDDQIRYTPYSGFTGRDSLVYQICDSNEDCDTAIVYLRVRVDTDGDGLPDEIDIDDDNDGIPDVIEVCGMGATSFACLGGFDPAGDADMDGIVNWADEDFGPLNANGCVAALDSDGDGIPDFLDRDSDNDGIPDVVEAYGVDANGDGVIDNFTDTDFDGLSQNVDANNTGAAGSGDGLGFVDLDGDGIPNSLDLDSDNDGIPDIREVGAPDNNFDGRVDNYFDSDGDGLADAYDGDADNNGFIDNVEGPLLKTGFDANNDGRTDTWPNKNMDMTGRPNPYDLDSDGDGIVDAIEFGYPGSVIVSNGIVTGARTNGWANSVISLGSYSPLNTDGRGQPDYLDIDSDDDGITDNVEGQATFSFKVATDIDIDNDGIADIYEASPGTFGGAGITPYDFDADGIPDYRDLDSDNDGAPDINEASRIFTINAGNINTTDTDGDGLVDEFDNIINSSLVAGECYKMVSNSNMGPNGNFDGPIPSGSNAKMVRSAPSGDRDFRSIVVLPLEVINLTGNLQGLNATLYWNVMSEHGVKHYLIERSVDGNKFEVIGTVSSLNQPDKNYNYPDNLSRYPQTKVYYRVRKVLQNGAGYYSNVVAFSLNTNLLSAVKVYPNPATDVVWLGIRSENNEVVNIEVLNGAGKSVLKKAMALQKGENTVQLGNLENLPAAIYMVRVITKDRVYIEKVIKQE